MKHGFKLLSLFVSFVIVIAGLPVGAAAAVEMGDVDAENGITPTDALYILQNTVELRELTSAQRFVADVSADGQVNATDALYVLQHTVGLIDQFEADKLLGEKKGLYGVKYEYIGDAYRQTRPAVEIDGPRTSVSNDREYAATMHVNADLSLNTVQNADRWREAGYTVGTTGSFNRIEGYGELYPEDKQVDASGDDEISWNSLVLTPRLIQYFLDHRIAPDLACDPQSICFVEPEMFRLGLYGEGYKKLWKEAYGTDWVDPLSSPAAVFQSQRLNIKTQLNAVNAYGDFLKAQGSKAKLGIAPHDIMSYNYSTNTGFSGITQGYHHMMMTGKIGTVTGQTWSNTMSLPYTYAGKEIRYWFMQGLNGYGSYLDATMKYGADFYALNDAMADNHYTDTEANWRIRNHDQLVSSLMYPEINRWEFIWTNRSFMYVSPEYRAEQMNIYNAMQDISGKEYTLTAGTPGVTYLLSDTLSWQIPQSGWCQSPYQSYYGVTMPLYYDGIPVRTKAMELIASPEDLEGVSLLIVSYDNMKPLTEEINVALADWVKEGGTLLYLGGGDDYASLEDEWWNAPGKGGSPLGNLFGHLGMDVQIGAVEEFSFLEWTAGKPDDRFGDIMAMGSGDFDQYYTGSGFREILRNTEGQSVGIESKVGDGHVLAVGLSTYTYTTSEEYADLMRILTEYAMRYTDYRYVASPSFVAERGDYVAVHPVSESVTLQGRFVDIFTNTLSVLDDPTIQPGDSRLFYRVEDDGQTQLAYTGGIQDELLCSDTQTKLTYHGAENALVASRFLAPEGKQPVKVEAVDSRGVSVAPACEWDAATSSLLVQAFTGPDDPTCVTVDWGDGEAVASSQYQWVEFEVNNKNADAAYLVTNTANASDTCRFCDGAGELVYRFDLSKAQSATVALSVWANYLIEVSADGVNWQTAVDYSAESETRAVAMNAAVRTLCASDYGLGDTMYVRLRNTDPSQGWGGALEKITVQYLPR